MIIKINVSNVENVRELHEILKNKLELPEFYGKNWSAFWDCITGMIELPENIEFIGWKLMDSRIPAECDKFKKIFDQFNEQFPELKCDVIYN